MFSIIIASVCPTLTYSNDTNHAYTFTVSTDSVGLCLVVSGTSSPGFKWVVLQKTLQLSL